MSTSEPKEDLLELLDSNARDHVVTGIKAIVGIMPYGGSVVGEIIGAAIPKQRADRIAAFIKTLDGRVASLEQKLQGLKGNERFCEFFYESLRQAAYSTSEERIEYLVSLVGNSLSNDEMILPRFL